MTDYSITNPMLEDDDDETQQTPAAGRSVLTLPRRPVGTTPTVHSIPTKPVGPNSPSREPRFGEVGYRKGVPNTRRGTPRARVTEGNALYLAFGAVFPGADSEAYSVLSFTRPSPVSKGGELPTITGTEKRLDKLKRLGMMESFRREGSKIVHWGVTDKGIAAAREFGYLQEESAPARDGIRGMSYERLNHYRLIAHVAAQFASPSGFFAQATPTVPGEVVLGVPAVSLEHLISEAQVRRDQKPIADRLFELKKAGAGSGDFGQWRDSTIQKACKEVAGGQLGWADFVECYPAIRTLGQPQSTDQNAQVKSSHWPDLVVSREAGRTGREGRSIVVEVELSRKSWTEYEQILRTYAREFADPVVYEQVVYFTVNDQIETLMRKVDTKYGFHLFESGRLKVKRIRNREGELVELKRRIEK